MYNAGNIANHYFTVPFLERIIQNHLNDLGFHVAKKKIPYLNEQQEVVKPEKPNGVKLEMFVFDVFRFSQKVGILSVKRYEEFSPLKNAPGAKECTPETCREDVRNLHHFFSFSFSLLFFF